MTKNDAHIHTYHRQRGGDVAHVQLMAAGGDTQPSLAHADVGIEALAAHLIPYQVHAVLHRTPLAREQRLTA